MILPCKESREQYFKVKKRSFHAISEMDWNYIGLTARRLIRQMLLSIMVQLTIKNKYLINFINKELILKDNSNEFG